MSAPLKLTISLDFKGSKELDHILEELKQKHNIAVSIDKDAVEAPLKEIGDTGNKVIGSLSNAFTSLGLSMLGVREAANMIKNAISAIVQPADTFQQLSIRLRNLYGDAKKAAEAFETFKHIAITTPFELDDVMQAGVQLKAFGLNAEDTLKSITDLAAYMGTSASDAANAVGRAFAGGTGAAIMLRDRGILELIKSFNGIDDLSKLTLPEFREAMLSTFTDPVAGIAGATDRLADSYTGAVANMQDAWLVFKANLGQDILPALEDGARAVARFLDSFQPTKVQEMHQETRNSIEQYLTLTSILRNLGDVTNGTDDEKQQFKSTIVSLNEQYGNYIGKLDTSITKYNQLSGAIEKAKNKLIEEAAAKMIMAKAEDAADDIVKLQTKIMEYRKTNAQLEVQYKQSAITYKELSDSYTAFGKIAINAGGDPLLQAQLKRQADIEKNNKAIDKAKNKIVKKQKEIEQIYQDHQDVLKSLIATPLPEPPSTKLSPEQIERLRSQHEQELQLLILKKQNGYDVIDQLTTKYDKYFDFLEKHYGKDSITYQQALRDKYEAKETYENTDTIKLQFEKELELLNLKRQNNYDVTNELKDVYINYFDYLQKTYKNDSLEYQKALNQKINYDRDYALRLANLEREKLAKKRAIEQASWDFQQNLLMLEDPEQARLNNQLRNIENFYEEKKQLLIDAGITEQQITAQKEKAIQSLERDSMFNRLKYSADGLGAMANNLAQLGGTGFKISKALQRAQVLLETPAAAMSAYRSVVGIPVIGPTLAPIAFATAIAVGGQQLQAIDKAKPPKAQYGGLTGLLKGPSHQQGGIIIEAEGDEYIINKNRVKELGTGFFDFINYSPIQNIKESFKALKPPNLPPIPTPSYTFASGGRINTYNQSPINHDQDPVFLKLNETVDELKQLKQTLIDKNLTVHNHISANEIINKADPVTINKQAEKGEIIRSRW